MIPFNKKGYKTAVVTRNGILSVAQLSENINCICNYLQSVKITNNDNVIVYLSDYLKLLPVIAALNSKAISFVIAHGGTDLEGLKTEYNAKYLITDKKQANHYHFYHNIVFEDMLNCGVAKKREESTYSYKDLMFYDSGDGRNQIVVKTAAAIEGYYEKLDTAIVNKQRIFLSECLSFAQIIFEMLWASSRGITVIVDSFDGNIELEKYMSLPNAFPMDFSLFYFGSYVDSTGKEPYNLLFSTAQYADQNDFSAIWTPERHFNEFGGLYPNPSVISAALAVNTSKIQLRSGSLVSPLHHSARIAEDWSVVDNISNGRVAISFASGWQCDDFVFFPENYPNRHEHMMQQIKTVKSLWKGEKVAFKNGLGNDVQVAIYPKPVQKELPVWITVSGKIETFIDAGKIGANILTHLLWQDTDELIDKIAAYRKSLEENGFDPRSGIVSVMAHTYLGGDNETVKNKVRQPLKNYILSSTQLIQSMAKSVAQSADAKNSGGRYGNVTEEIPKDLLDELTEIAFNRFFEQAGLLGTVEKAEVLIRKLKSYDVDEIACLTDFGLEESAIKESLTYLNKLRKLYDDTSNSNHTVNVLRCSLTSLKHLEADNRFSAFLKEQKNILVEAEDFENIPASLLPRVKIIHNKIIDGENVYQIKPDMESTDHLQTHFNAVVDDVF